jgi:RHS repeat-associated protein
MPFCFATQLNLSYDANGNLISGDGKYREYNSLNQLWKVYNGSTNATLLQEYTYHPVEERVLIKKTFNSTGSVIETVYYFTPEWVQVKNLSGTFNFTYVYQNGQLIAQINPDGTKLFFANDIKGDIVVVINSSGNVIENNSYTPFGDVITGGTKTRFGYEGKEKDSFVGDIDFKFRKYNPSLGIFTQPDKSISDALNPQNLNRYSFTLNNPFKYTDPNGKDAVIINYNLGTTVLGKDPGHSSGIIGNNKNDWIVYYFGTTQNNVYNEKSHVSATTTGGISFAHGKTWKEAIQNFDTQYGTNHDLSTAVYFESSLEQDEKMKEYVFNQLKEQSTGNYLNYNPITRNCGMAVADVLDQGGIQTNRNIFPNDYNKMAKSKAAINNAMYDLQQYFAKMEKAAKKWYADKHSTKNG